MKYKIGAPINLLLCGFATLLPVNTPVVFAAPPAQSWHFENEKQLKNAILDYADNPRATYYVILRAHSQKLSGEAAVAYYELLRKKPGDPQIQSAFAFSHFMATGILSYEFATQKAAKLTRELRKQQLEAEYYRNEAIKAKPKSPTILVETAQYLLYENNGRPKAVGYLRTAAELSPKWEQAHFWLGKGLILLSAGKPKETAVPLGREAFAAYQKAEQLSPKLHTECLIGYAYSYQAMGQHDKELQYLDAYIKAKPAFGKKVGVIKWRRELFKRTAKKQT